MNILILHGWGSGAKNWSRVRELLENYGYKVFVPDLPGFGENPSPSQPWSLNDYAQWVKDFVEKNNLDQFFLLGHSFGGILATKFSLKYPEKVKKLFLIDCAGIRRKSIKKQAIKKISKFFKIFSFLPFYSLFRKCFYKIIKSDYPNVKEGAMKETYYNVIKEDISKLFSNIAVPTVIIWGRKDKLTPLKDAYYIKEKIFRAKLDVLSNIAHNPQSENPELLVKKILTYINEN